MWDIYEQNRERENRNNDDINHNHEDAYQSAKFLATSKIIDHDAGSEEENVYNSTSKVRISLTVLNLNIFK